jgi:hypothetical protein
MSGSTDISTEASPVALQSFEDHAGQVLTRIRGTVSQLLAELEPSGIKPQNISRHLGLDKSLARKVAKIAQARAPFDVVQFLPGTSGVEILLQAAQQAGGRPTLIEGVRAAFNDFDRLVELHAGDRQTLEIMIRGAAPHSEEQIDEATRKSHFRAASCIWGAQARVQLKVDFLAPSSTPGVMDYAGASGFVDFRRLRPGVPWGLARKRVTDDAGRTKGHMAIKPLDPDFDKPDAVPMLGEYCSHPIPKTRPVLAGDGFTEYELVEGPVGKTASITCVTGVVCRDAIPYYRTEDNRIGEHVLYLRTPAELMFFDLFVHESLPLALPPQFTMYGQLQVGTSYPQTRRDRNVLPVSPPVDFLGSGPPIASTADIPRYQEMIDHIFQRVGWRAEEFRGYRVVLAYPPIPAAAVLSFDLPAAGDQ